MIKAHFPEDFEKDYQTHIKRLKLNGMASKTIEPYGHAVRRAQIQGKVSILLV